MKIIAIDPGYDRVGIALLEKKEGGKEQVLFSECFQTNKKKSIHERIFDIGERISFLVDEYKPSVFVIEGLFFSKNTKTALSVAEARGAMINIAHQKKLSIHEYTPNQIKVAVAGYGKANKKDIFFMVEKLVDLSERKRIDDELDAIAIALTFFASYRF